MKDIGYSELTERVYIGDAVKKGGYIEDEKVQAGIVHGESNPAEILERVMASNKSKAKNNSIRSKQIGGNHYKNKKLQPWDIIDALDLTFYEGNTLKYLLRYKEKNGVEDLKKAIHYIEKIIKDIKEK